VNNPEPASALHPRFLLLLPRLVAHGGAYFRHVRCPQKRDDLVAEAVAIAWRWYRLLVQRGRDPHAFAATLVHRALLQARSYRRLCGQHKTKDALSPLAQSRHGFRACGAVLEALADNSRTPPPEQAAFRIDFPDWLSTLGEGRRRVALALMSGERPRDVARAEGVSPGRVSQLRAELRDRWLRFCGEHT
jgi:DNA-directed RNA polymerase specialized sigma24 family protein